MLNNVSNEFIDHVKEYSDFSETMNIHQLSQACQNYTFNKSWDQDFLDLVPIAISKITKNRLIVFKIINENEFTEINQSYENNYKQTVLVVLDDNHYNAVI